MQKADKQEYEVQQMEKLQYLIEARKQKYTQSDMAFIAGVSLKTIQNFENYRSLNNAWLFYVYENLLI